LISIKQKIEEFYERSDTLSNKTFDSFKQMENLCQNWFKFINEDFKKELNTKFDDLNKIREQNIRLEFEIQSKQQNAIKELITKIDFNSNKSTNHLTENDLMIAFNELQTFVNSIKTELNSKKSLKTQLTNETKNVQKLVDDLKNRQKELLKEKSDNNSNDCITIANVMRIMYKTWNNSKVVGRKALAFI
jgi:chromosome segregation ATPase